MPRPLVAVYQEYRSLNFTPAAADLNTCVAAVAYQVKDYDSANPLDTLVAAEYTRDGVLEVAVPGLMTGAQLSTATVTFVNPEEDVFFRDSASTSAGSRNTVDISGSGLNGNALFKEGDRVYVDGMARGVVTAFTATTFNTSESLVDDGTLAQPLVSVQVTRRIPGAFKVGPDFVAMLADNAAGKVNIAALAELAAGQYSGTNSVGGKKIGRATLHIGFTARRTDLNKFVEVPSAADIPTLLGPVDPRNPLALAAWVALQNTGTKIIAYGVTADTEAGFAAFQHAVAPRSDIYCVVPVSLNPATQLTVVQAMNTKFVAMSDPDTAIEQGVPQRFKMVVAGGFTIADPKIVAKTTAATSETYGERYLLTAADGQFYTRGVRVNDAITMGSYTGVVEQVLSNQQLIYSGPILSGALNVTRELSNTERAEEYAAVPKALNSKRAVMLLGDSITLSAPSITTESVSAAYLGCAVGGMIAGLPPHSGITNMYVNGVADIAGTHTDFDEAQLSDLSDAGWCVFIEDAPSAAPYCIHGVTTDPSASEMQEIMFVKNFDYVSATLSSRLNGFIGTWNVNEETFGFISSALSAGLDALKNRKVAKLGAPVTSYTLTSIGASATNSARVEAYVELKLPMSLNNIGLHLVSV